MSAVDDAFARMWDALREKHGVCGYCGKKKCAGRKQWATIPEGARIPVADLEEAVLAAEPPRGRDGQP